MESFDFKNNIEVITNLIEKLVMPKFPKITGIEDIEHFSSGFRGDSYYVHMTTSEYLESEEQVEIDSLIKQLFKMASLDSANQNPFKLDTDKIMSFFDCGDGEGFNFNSPFGYTH
jgi:hypothetical protein